MLRLPIHPITSKYVLWVIGGWWCGRTCSDWLMLQICGLYHNIYLFNSHDLLFLGHFSGLPVFQTCGVSFRPWPRFWISKLRLPRLSRRIRNFPYLRHPPVGQSFLPRPGQVTRAWKRPLVPTTVEWSRRHPLVIPLYLSSSRYQRTMRLSSKSSKLITRLWSICGPPRIQTGIRPSRLPLRSLKPPVRLRNSPSCRKHRHLSWAGWGSICNARRGSFVGLFWPERKNAKPG